ncbi:MAG: hypothetical protein J4400_03545 [Candidatus Aenigmarchaeota archaeon]|nr:hypothetical protein [Candidatus Aenigmarchaeota archaeon]
MRNYMARIWLSRDTARHIVEVPVESYAHDSRRYPNGYPYREARKRATRMAKRIALKTKSDGYMMQVFMKNEEKNIHHEWSPGDWYIFLDGNWHAVGENNG